MSEEKKEDVAVCIQMAVAKDANGRLWKSGLTCSVEEGEVSVSVERRGYLVAFDVYVTTARDANTAHYVIGRTVEHFIGRRFRSAEMVRMKSFVDEDTLEKGWSIEAVFRMTDKQAGRCIDEA